MSVQQFYIVPYTRWNWRKRKKYIKKTIASILKTGYFEGCDARPHKLEKITPLYWIKTTESVFSADCEGTALDGKGGCCCSIWHCSPMALSKEEAYKMLEQNNVE